MIDGENLLVDHDILMYAFDHALYKKIPTPMVVLDAVRHNLHKLSLYEITMLWTKIVYAERLQFDYNGNLLDDEGIKNVWLELREYLGKEIEIRTKKLQNNKPKVKRSTKKKTK